MATASAIILVSAGSLAVLGTLLHFAFPTLLEYGVRDQIKIEEGNQIFDKWIKVPIAITYKLTFLTVENPREAVRGAKIRVKEAGPYYFNQFRRKKILNWGTNNGTVRYYEYKTYFFDGKRTGGLKLSDRLTVINPPFAALCTSVNDLVSDQLPFAAFTSPLVYGAVNAFLDTHRQNLFMTKTVRELIYGYKVNLLETISTLIQPLKAFGINIDMLPDIPADNKFGVLMANGTPEGPFEVYTGQDGTSKKFGSFVSFKDQSKLVWWKADGCNALKGTDGTQFAPKVKKTEDLYIFATDICRSASLVFKEESSFKGMPTYRFELNPQLFDVTPENECFCLHKTRPQRCRFGGTMDLGGCQSGAPVLLSKPHFLYTDPDLSQLVEGLAPDPEKHDTFLDIDPQAGLNDELTNEVKDMLVKPVQYANNGIIGTAAVGWFVFVVAFFYRRYQRNKSRKLTTEAPAIPVKERKARNERTDSAIGSRPKRFSPTSAVTPTFDGNDMGPIYAPVSSFRRKDRPDSEDHFEPYSQPETQQLRRQRQLSSDQPLDEETKEKDIDIHGDEVKMQETESQQKALSINAMSISMGREQLID